jgi:soluble lytic murein transglycosylase-like protein
MNAASAFAALARRGVGRCRTATMAVFALCAGALPGAAQEPQTAQTAPAAQSPRLQVAPAQEMDQIWTRELWDRLRAEARRFRETHAPFAFARRYRISSELATTIHDAARAEGIDPELAFRLVRVESNFNPRARSPVGALGLTQLMPYTARMVDRSMITRERILEPEANLRVGFRYLRGLIGHYRGDVGLALVAYNRGEGAVDRDLRRGRDPENGYGRMVLGRGLDRYRGSGLVAR